MNKWKIAAYIVAIIGILLLGFYLGRTTIKNNIPETIVKYTKGEKITDSIPYPVPVNTIRPIDTANIIMQCVKNGIYYELFPEKTITEYIEITKEDTSKILEDWATKRIYSEKLFDSDTIGSCIVNATVQYNRLSLLEYTYTPVIKQTIINSNKIKLFSPFIGGGFVLIPTKNYINMGLNIDGGFFIKEKYGVKLQYGHMFDIERNNIFGASFIYKF
jgi:hypothetical protein